MAGSMGAAAAAMTDPDRIWSEAAQRLRVEIGEGAFSSYIAPSAVRCDTTGQLILVTPTAYARDWVRKNALRRINELWLAYDRSSRRLDVRCRAEIGSAPPVGLGGRAAPPAQRTLDVEENPLRTVGRHQRPNFSRS